MSENNDFDYETQTPPPKGEKPDYSYNWKGSEHNNNNKKTGFKIAIVTVVALIIATVTISGIMIFLNLNQEPSEISSYENVSMTDGPQKPGGDKPDGDKPDGDKPPKKPDGEGGNGNKVPEFTPSGDSETDLSTALTQIYENCSPSCCTVSVTYANKGYSIGSGFVIDAESGYIATNHHVIDKASKISVIFYDGKEYEAKLIGSDSVTDLAVLKIEAEGLVQVELGDSNAISVGENVVAIGTPYDKTLAGTMTRGIISGIKRNIDITNDAGKVIKTMTLIQTDCSINPGNSGGPLIDMAGNVIGITSLKLVDEQFEGIGFAIPITDATEIFKKLIAGEDIGESGIATATPRIGISVTDVQTGIYALGIRPSWDYPEKGVFVAEVTVSSSAYKAGLGAYNTIVDFNGRKIETSDDLTNALAKYKAGETVQITAFQFNRTFTSGEYKTIEFKLDAAE